ncbi:MAG TPA: M28 family metallopeptidase [Chloroflexia bacterium]|nr:M28 family metallopeptidase [Chloroflexia bacterium]
MEKLQHASGKENKRQTFSLLIMLALILSLLLAACGEPSTVVPATSPAVSITASAIPLTDEVGQFRGESAYRHVVTLAGFGSRELTGNGHKQAEEYLKAQFSTLGLKPTIRSSLYNWLRDGGSYLTLLKKDDTVRYNFKLIYLAENSQPESETTALYLKDYPSELASLSGKVIIVDENLSGFEQLMFAWEKAAPELRPMALLIIAKGSDPVTSPTLTRLFLTIGIVEQAAGQELAGLTQPGEQKVKLSLNWENIQQPISNIEAIRLATGGVSNAPLLLFGAHYDTLPGTPGADDNASGVAVLLETARIIANAYPQFEMRFIAFDGEELGLIGSRAYAEALSAAEKQRIVAVFNFDMLAGSSPLEVEGSPALLNLVKPLLSQSGFEDVSLQAPNHSPGGSDHASFASLNLPYLSFIRPGDKNIHRPGDVAANFGEKPLTLVGQLTTGVLEKLLQP